MPAILGRFRPAPALAPIVLGGLLSACVGGVHKEQPAPHVLAAVTPTEQFSIEVASVPDEILLAPHGALSSNQSAALGELASRWRETGGSPIVVEASAGAGGGTAQAAVQALQAYGVPAESVQVKPAGEGDASAPAPVRVGFTRLAAIGPNCAGMWDELTNTGRNLTHSSFGCATTANMAAMIADPRDLTRPRDVAASDGDRRANVLGKYRKGQSTASERGDDERGAVSRSIQ